MHDFNIEKNDGDPKLEVGDHVKISKYKNIFGKDCTPNWVKKLLKKLKTFYEKELQKTNQKEFRVEKIIYYMSKG